MKAFLSFGTVWLLGCGVGAVITSGFFWLVAVLPAEDISEVRRSAMAKMRLPLLIGGCVATTIGGVAAFALHVL